MVVVLKTSPIMLSNMAAVQSAAVYSMMAVQRISNAMHPNMVDASDKLGIHWCN